MRSRSVKSRAWSQALLTVTKSWSAQIRDCLEITLDARDLALEIWRTHTRDCKRCHLALARSGHGYRLIGQLCAQLCAIMQCAPWVARAHRSSSPRDGSSPSAWRGAPRRALSLASAPPIPSVAQTQCARARATYTPSRWRVRFVGTRWSARATWEKRAPLRWKPAQRSSDARVSGSARASAASKISPPSVVTAWLRAPSEATSCGDVKRVV